MNAPFRITGVMSHRLWYVTSLFNFSFDPLTVFHFILLWDGRPCMLSPFVNFSETLCLILEKVRPTDGSSSHYWEWYWCPLLSLFLPSDLLVLTLDWSQSFFASILAWYIHMMMHFFFHENLFECWVSAYGLGIFLIYGITVFCLVHLESLLICKGLQMSDYLNILHTHIYFF